MKLSKINSKKGAIELSIGTIVVIVLAMTMLILGIVLVRNIFTGATDNVIEINKGVEDEIKKLFSDEDERLAVRLSDNTARMKLGERFGVAFGVNNVKTGETTVTTFNYEVTIDDPRIRENCGVSEQEAQSWVEFNTGTVSVRPGEVSAKSVIFDIPETAPLCLTRYKIIVWEQGKTRQDLYAETDFFIEIKKKGVF